MTTNKHHVSTGPIRVRTETNPHGKGWVLAIRLGKGAGYRALDFPWHSNNIADGWRCRRSWLSYVPGYTLTVATNQRRIGNRADTRRFLVSLTRRCGHGYIPNWWT